MVKQTAKKTKAASANKKTSKKAVKKDEVKPEEIEHEVLQPTKVDEGGDEPSWYHYLFVIVVFLSFFFMIYVGFEVYEDFTTPEVPELNTTLPTTTYKYPYVVGNITYNLFFFYPIDELNEFDHPVEPTKFDLLNSRNITFAYDEYVGTDNGKIAASSTKLRRFFELVYVMDFGPENFARINESNCTTSTSNNKVITFDPYTNETGVFYDRTTGCVEFKGQNGDEIVKLIDKLMYELTEQ